MSERETPKDNCDDHPHPPLPTINIYAPLHMMQHMSALGESGLYFQSALFRSPVVRSDTCVSALLGKTQRQQCMLVVNNKYTRVRKRFTLLVNFQNYWSNVGPVEWGFPLVCRTFYWSWTSGNFEPCTAAVTSQQWRLVTRYVHALVQCTFGGNIQNAMACVLQTNERQLIVLIVLSKFLHFFFITARNCTFSVLIVLSKFLHFFFITARNCAFSSQLQGGVAGGIHSCSEVKREMFHIFIAVLPIVC